MNQLQLPLSFEDFIPENHFVRGVNTVVDSLELKPLYDRYKEGGCPAYHPRMMLKVMIYSFSQKIYSSRQIAKALRENINFLWIAGGNKPDFRTINRFRLDGIITGVRTAEAVPMQQNVRIQIKTACCRYRTV